MVDIVVNHMGWLGNIDSVNYSVFNPFNTQADYHPYCPIDYNNATSEQIVCVLPTIRSLADLKQCWMGDTSVPLPDLRTEDATVASQYQTWIQGLVSTYGIDGIRLDSVMEVNTGFWQGFLNAAGVYMVGEVDYGDPGFVCSFQNYVPGVLNYAT